ncbi:MogA/MoaB family molybdenum cofactor biosynthesis protein [uncultured Merdimonas sp.]|uniref:MogA/MoaB family molybdenum cofactor biosynthesis protein n=1 Tax=uncultured Merdimonas sp. TaxID=2023269 RepID=UPI003207F959
MKVAIITANTDIYKERQENTSGEIIRDMVTEAGLEIVFLRALPRDRKVLSTVMQRMADNHLTDLILVTGGSGLSAGDCTPEATRDVIEREVPGIGEAIRAHAAELTKRAMLNRGIAGIRQDVLIVDLPGRPEAAREALHYLMPELIHAVKVIKGEL